MTTTTKRNKSNSRKSVLLKILSCITILFVCSLYPQSTKLINNHVVQQQSTHMEELMFQPYHQSPLDPSSSSKTSLTKPTIVYSKLRGDQSGWVIFDMLKAHAYCFALNVTYGGACGNSAHKHDIVDVLKAVGWDEILPLKCPPPPESKKKDSNIW